MTVNVLSCLMPPQFRYPPCTREMLVVREVSNLCILYYKINKFVSQKLSEILLASRVNMTLNIQLLFLF